VVEVTVSVPEVPASVCVVSVVVVTVLDKVSPDAILGGTAVVPEYVTSRPLDCTAETVTVPNPASSPEII